MKYSTIVLFPLFAVLCGCDPLAHPVSGRLSFSSDTISFDTVFSGYATATLELRVRNPEKDALLIDRIWLGGGATSPFRINIDGVLSVSREEVTIAGRDSLFIFISLLADHTGDDDPVVITDSVNFASGSYRGRVILMAWGQDVIVAGGLIGEDTFWESGKPYLVKDRLLVDTTARLTLAAGTRIYMQHDASVTVAGSLRAEGSAERPVVIATDRTEREYIDIPGRWKGIRYLSCSRDNLLGHTEIRNATVAVQIEGEPSSRPDMTMNGARLLHNSVASLVAQHAELFAVNSLFAHSGFSTVSLTGSGSYEFIHCTVSNRWEYSNRSGPAMKISESQGMMPQVTVTSSVISGTLANELLIEGSPAEAAACFAADSSLIRIDTLKAPWYSPSLFRGVITTLMPRFIDEPSWDFRPDTLSPLLDRAGRREMARWPVDIRGKPRPSGDGPDIGAYERQPGERREVKDE